MLRSLIIFLPPVVRVIFQKWGVFCVNDLRRCFFEKSPLVDDPLGKIALLILPRLQKNSLYGQRALGLKGAGHTSGRPSPA